MKEIRDQFEISAHPRNAGAARARVREIAVRAGISLAELADIEIAVGEAVTNAILYGSPSASSRVIITSIITEHLFSVEVRDEGRGFDPSQLHLEEGTEALGGRGLRLMYALMNQVELHHDGEGMVARLSKEIPSSSEVPVC